MTKTKECRGLKKQNQQTKKKPFDFSSSSRIQDPFLFLENPRHLSLQGTAVCVSLLKQIYGLEYTILNNKILIMFLFIFNLIYLF